MNLPEQTEIQYRRPQPDAWGRFVGMIETNEIEQSAYQSYAHPIMQEMVAMDLLTFDTNRFYAQGLIICKFARELIATTQDANMRNTLVDDGARAMREGYENRSVKPDGVIKGLFPNDANKVFYPIYDKAIEDEKPSHIELGRCFAGAARLRIASADDQERLQHTAHNVARRTLSPNLHQSLRRMIFAGLVDIRFIIQGHHKEVTNNPDPLPDVRDIALLRNPATLRFMQSAAKRPFIDSIGPVERGLAFDTNGLVAPFNIAEDNIKVELARHENPDARYDSLVCPAMNLGSLFSTMYGLTVDMLERASS